MSNQPTIVDAVLGSDIPYVTYAIPLFTFLAVLELVFSTLAGRHVYRINDSISDLGCGIIDQTVKAVLHAAVLGAYIFVFENYRVQDVAAWSPAAKILGALLCFVGVDFCFYWHHRFGHEWSAGWAAHSVHHQSEEFNLVVALRQSALEHHITSFFYLPLAWLGIPPSWYVAMFAFNLIWQFWCHTRLVGKLGPMEWLFITPSHHRVHHGRNPKYLDKNYGGMLIIWDKLFGTFQIEEEEPVYGVTKPLKTWNPVWANLEVWRELARDAWYAPSWADKVRVWFMPLGWSPTGLPIKPDPPEVSAETIRKYNPRLPGVLTAYGFVHFGIATLLSLTFFALTSQHAPLGQLWDLVAFAMLSLLAMGGLFDLRRWVPAVELVRLPLLVGLAYYRTAGTSYVVPVVGLAALVVLVSAAVIIAYRSTFVTTAEPPEPVQAHYA